MASSTAPPVVCKLPNLLAPCLQPSYEEGWQAFTSNSSQQTVHSVVFRGPYMVGATRAGEICVFSAPLFQENVDNDVDMTAVDSKDKRRRSPLLRVQVTQGILYSLRFVERNDKTILFVSGGEGVWGYDWKDWLDLVDDPTAAPPPVLTHFRPPSSRSIKSFDFMKQFLFSATNSGIHKFDLEAQKLVATYPSKGGSIHTLGVTPQYNIITGGDDGHLSIWDGYQDKQIDYIDLKSNFTDIRKQGNHAPTLSKTSKVWISHVESSSDNWWTVCGGADVGTTRLGGHVSLWHAPTRSLVTACTTRETPQHACATKNTLITVANEGVVSHWSTCQLERTARVWCSPPSVFAASIRQEDDCLAVGGVGSRVDIFENLVDKAYSLTITDTQHDM